MLPSVTAGLALPTFCNSFAFCVCPHSVLLWLHIEELCDFTLRTAHAILAIVARRCSSMLSVAGGFLGTAAHQAQSAERKALNLVIVRSSPTVGVSFAWPILPARARH